MQLILTITTVCVCTPHLIRSVREFSRYPLHPVSASSGSHGAPDRAFTSVTVAGNGAEVVGRPVEPRPSSGEYALYRSAHRDVDEKSVGARKRRRERDRERHRRRGPERNSRAFRSTCERVYPFPARETRHAKRQLPASIYLPARVVQQDKAGDQGGDPCRSRVRAHRHTHTHTRARQTHAYITRTHVPHVTLRYARLRSRIHGTKHSPRHDLFTYCSGAALPPHRAPFLPRFLHPGGKSSWRLAHVTARRY